MKVLAIIEDEPDLRLVVKLTLESDPDFEVVGEAASISAAVDLLEHARGAVGLIVLDNQLEGDLTGLEAAPTLKKLAPESKIILFTAHEHLAAEADKEPAIDAFLLKTQLPQLLPLVHELVG